MTKWLDGFTRAEWRVLNISFVLMMICAFLLSNERLLSRIWPTGGAGVTEALGEISRSQGDVRIKSAGGAMRPAEGSLRLGEVVAVGADGNLAVKVRPGVELQAAPNSLFRLTLIEGLPLFDLLGGKFIWNVRGDFEISVKGERAVLKGEPAVLEIELASGLEEPVVKTTSGRGAFQLRKAIAGPDAQAPAAAPMPNEVYFYVWRLEDLYSVSNRTLEPKAGEPERVPTEIILNWQHSSAHGPFSVQLSRSMEFTGAKDFFNTSDQTFTLEKAFLGANYWRVSFNDLYWSEVRGFKVEARFLELALKPLKAELQADSEADVEVRWEPSEPMHSYIAEYSQDAGFPQGQTQRNWLPAPVLKTQLPVKGRWFARLRGLNARNEISDWSPPVRILIR